MFEERRKDTIPVVFDRRKNSDILFQSLLNTMSVIVIITEGNLILYANDCFFKSTGYTQNDLPLLHLSDLFTDMDKDFLMYRVQRRLQGDLSLPDIYNDLEIVRKDKSILSIDLFPNLVYYNDKLCNLYTGLETTKHKKLEKALNGFFEFCPVPAFIKDKNHRLVKATPFYTKITGKNSLEIIGKNSHELFDSEFADKLDEEDTLVMMTKKTLTVEEILFDKTYVKIKFPINGDLIGGFSVDVTEKVNRRKEIEESNRKYEELYNVLVSMLDTIPSMYWVYDCEKNISFANKILRDYSPIIDIFDTDICMSLPEEKEIFTKIINEGTEDEVYLEITKYPLYNTEGKITGCIGHLEDVTDNIKTQKSIVTKLEKINSESKNGVTTLLNILNTTVNSFARKQV